MGFLDSFFENLNELDWVKEINEDSGKSKEVANDSVSRLANCYVQVTMVDERYIETLPNARRTIENLGCHSVNDAISLIRTYSNSVNVDEDSSGFCAATISALEFMEENEISVGRMVSAIDSAGSDYEYDMLGAEQLFNQAIRYV